jgi:hypothetical protein
METNQKADFVLSFITKKISFEELPEKIKKVLLITGLINEDGNFTALGESYVESVLLKSELGLLD